MVKKEFEGMSKAGYRVNHMNAMMINDKGNLVKDT